MKVQLDGALLQFVDTVEYLGLQICKRGFIGKMSEELETKCNGDLQTLIIEPWFNLSLHPKHIARSYQTYIRSIILYGAELMGHEDRAHIYEVDEKMINRMFGKLLKLGRGRLSERRRWS